MVQSWLCGGDGDAKLVSVGDGGRQLICGGDGCPRLVWGRDGDPNVVCGRDDGPKLFVDAMAVQPWFVEVSVVPFGSPSPPQTSGHHHLYKPNLDHHHLHKLTLDNQSMAG